ncbi:hypothetical protein [Halostella litorea]|uniref:hypothetical protein n=1 Tax=Halostella litorea TaxID=2528831 RepID=UPI001F1BE394|nr:hypothetical protein [Halostella litorea]
MSAGATPTVDGQDLETYIEDVVDERVREETAELREENERLHEELAEERARRSELEDAIEDLERQNQILKSQVDGVVHTQDLLVDGHSELASRELEKGAHLSWENVEPFTEELTISGDRLERFSTEDDEEYARLPGEADPLGRSGENVLTDADLLPIQQLARLDEDMLANEARPVQLAVKAWQNRDDTGDYGLWSKGSNEVELYMDASDLASEIRSWETGVSKEYSQKLAERAMDSLVELTKNRTYVKLRKRRKDGLEYKERRLTLPADAEIPGESPPTDDVGGE